MAQWHKAVIPPSASLRAALAAIDAAALQIAFVVEDGGRLMGVVTDGDIRRALLGGADLKQPVAEVMNRRPRVVTTAQSRMEGLALMREAHVHQVPVVDQDGKLVHVLLLDEVVQPQRRDNWVVLMAGGLGTRLRPFTDNCPKPMLQVGGRPLLETILLNLRAQGFRKFFLSVNYMAEMVEHHFGDGSRFGVQVDYLRETKRLGTGGALTLLPAMPTLPFVVANGDILTTLDFGQMVDFHVAQKTSGTMGIRDYEVSIPYGVVDTDGVRITGMREKPTHRFFVNSGLYVLSPEALDLIPRGEMYDMPTLFERLQSIGRHTAAFQVREYWMDIGRPEDLSRANTEYERIFGR